MILRSVAFFIVVAAPFATAQVPNPTESVLQHRLVGNYLTLRSAYAGDKLNFKSNGSPKGRPKHGLRSVDGIIQVREVQLQSGSVVINADRILMVYDVNTGALASSGLNLPVHIQINISSPTPEHITETLNKVFFSAAELQARTCSADEKLHLQQSINRALDDPKPTTAIDGPSDDDESKIDVLPLCFPTGDRVVAALRKGKGISPPTIRTQEPDYDMPDRREKVHGTSKFLAEIGTDGLITDALLISGGDGRLNYTAIAALRNWVFWPARRAGVSVPVAIYVYINF